nr:MAG TPA: hypothetical protein [Caudoviricetes sp.]
MRSLASGLRCLKWVQPLFTTRRPYRNVKDSPQRKHLRRKRLSVAPLGRFPFCHAFPGSACVILQKIVQVIFRKKCLESPDFAVCKLRPAGHLVIKAFLSDSQKLST